MIHTGRLTWLRSSLADWLVRLADRVRPTHMGLCIYSEDKVFEMLVAAYTRGTQWERENPNSEQWVAKAANDYADGVTSLWTPESTAAHKIPVHEIGG